MNIRNFFLLFNIALVFLSACKKNPESDPEQPITNTFQNQEFIVNGVVFKMIAIEHGAFIKGEKTKNQTNTPVQLTNDYYLGETEVTQALWVAVMGENPSRFQDNIQNPVDSISWYDCQRFLKKLNQLTGKEFRCPTEAEWEYAARGGKLNEPYVFSGSDSAGAVAWYKENSGGKTHPVAQLQSNGLGLYDMTGNVHEWCEDTYKPGYYSGDTLINPLAKGDTTFHVIKGGNYKKVIKDGDLSVSTQYIEYSKVSGSGLGLRLTLSR